MNRLLLLLSNTLLVLLEVIVLTFFASIFFKKNLSTVKFLISIILLAAFNVTALALLDKYFWLKAFVLTIVDAICIKLVMPISLQKIWHSPQKRQSVKDL